MTSVLDRMTGNKSQSSRDFSVIRDPLVRVALIRSQRPLIYNTGVHPTRIIIS